MSRLLLRACLLAAIAWNVKACSRREEQTCNCWEMERMINRQREQLQTRVDELSNEKVKKNAELSACNEKFANCEDRKFDTAGRLEQESQKLELSNNKLIQKEQELNETRDKLTKCELELPPTVESVRTLHHQVKQHQPLIEKKDAEIAEKDQKIGELYLNVGRLDTGLAVCRSEKKALGDKIEECQSAKKDLEHEKDHQLDKELAEDQLMIENRRHDHDDDGGNGDGRPNEHVPRRPEGAGGGNHDTMPLGGDCHDPDAQGRDRMRARHHQGPESKNNRANLNTVQAGGNFQLREDVHDPGDRQGRQSNPVDSKDELRGDQQNDMQSRQGSFADDGGSISRGDGTYEMRLPGQSISRRQPASQSDNVGRETHPSRASQALPNLRDNRTEPTARSSREKPIGGQNRDVNNDGAPTARSKRNGANSRDESSGHAPPMQRCYPDEAYRQNQEPIQRQSSSCSGITGQMDRDGHNQRYNSSDINCSRQLGNGESDQGTATCGSQLNNFGDMQHDSDEKVIRRIVSDSGPTRNESEIDEPRLRRRSDGARSFGVFQTSTCGAGATPAIPLPQDLVAFASASSRENRSAMAYQSTSGDYTPPPSRQGRPHGNPVNDEQACALGEIGNHVAGSAESSMAGGGDTLATRSSGGERKTKKKRTRKKKGQVQETLAPNKVVERNDAGTDSLEQEPGQEHLKEFVQVSSAFLPGEEPEAEQAHCI